MATGKSVSVWYLEGERNRLEEAAALAGYRHVSKYIRDKSLDRGHGRQGGQGGVEEWVERQEIAERLEELERGLQSVQTMVAMVLALARQRSTTGQANELAAVMAGSRSARDVIASVAPGLAAELERMLKARALDQGMRARSATCRTGHRPAG